MRILHVIPQFPYIDDQTVIGGHASPLFTLAKRQVESGHEVTILSYVQGRAGAIKFRPGLTIVSIFPQAKTSTMSFGLRFLSGAIGWARQHRDDFDVAHVHSGFADYFLVSRRIMRTTGLATVHSLYCPIPELGNRVNWPIVRAGLRRCARSVDGLTAISNHTATSVLKYGIDRDVPIVPPALDLEKFRPARNGEISQLRRGLGLDDQEVVILFVGNAKPQKNLSGVLHAFRELRDRMDTARLVVTTELAAASTDENLARLKQEMAELKLERDVIQFGIIDNMPELLRAADILVAPFLDSFGPSDYFMAVLEAMASGKPAIVSAVGGMPEVIHGDVGRLVDPFNTPELSDALIELAEAPALRVAMGARARDVCEARFSVETISNEFDSLYQRIA